MKVRFDQPRHTKSVCSELYVLTAFEKLYVRKKLPGCFMQRQPAFFFFTQRYVKIQCPAYPTYLSLHLVLCINVFWLLQNGALSKIC